MPDEIVKRAAELIGSFDRDRHAGTKVAHRSGELKSKRLDSTCRHHFDSESVLETTNTSAGKNRERSRPGTSCAPAREVVEGSYAALSRRSSTNDVSPWPQADRVKPHARRTRGEHYLAAFSTAQACPGMCRKVFSNKNLW